MERRGKPAKASASSIGMTVIRDPKSSNAGKSAAASAPTQRATASLAKSKRVLQETAERDSDALERLAKR